MADSGNQCTCFSLPRVCIFEDQWDKPPSYHGRFQYNRIAVLTHDFWNVILTHNDSSAMQNAKHCITDTLMSTKMEKPQVTL